MAHSLRRPLSSLVGLSPSIQRRSFSQLPALRGQDRSQQAMAQARPAQQKERSLKVMSKNVGKLPSDMGILDSKHSSLVPQPCVQLLNHSCLNRYIRYPNWPQHPLPLRLPPRPPQTPMEQNKIPLPRPPLPPSPEILLPKRQRAVQSESQARAFDHSSYSRRSPHPNVFCIR